MKQIDLDVMIDRVRADRGLAEPDLVPVYNAIIDVLMDTKNQEIRRGRCLMKRIAFVPDDWHDWVVIAKDVCVGEGKRVNIMECASCGKVKTQ